MPTRLLLWIALAFLFSRNIRAQLNDATNLPLVLPSAITFDSGGNLYIAETGNHVIRKVDPQGHITIFAGTGTQGFSGDSGLATKAQLDSPQGLALTASTLYIADTHNHRIRAVSLTTNLITTVAGTGTSGFGGESVPATKAQLNLPTALAVDSVGNLYLADTANHRVRRMDAASGIITTVVGNGTQGYSGDNGTALSASIDSPSGLAVDSSGNLYLADTHNHRLRKVTAATGIISTAAGTGMPGSGAAQLALPQGLTLDPQGNVYLADTANHRILKIDASTGALTTIAGTGSQSFSGDSGPAAAATLDSPRAVAFTPTTQLTLSDTHNQRIRQIGFQSIDTIAGPGSLAPAELSISAPAVVTYGTGQLTVTLAASTSATGSITLLDTNLASTNALTSLPLSNNSASLSLTGLTAGTHVLVAIYAGDLTHPPARSAPFTLTVTPAPTVTTLSVLSPSTQPITVSAKVASTTSGTPTGTVGLFQGSSSVGSGSLTPAATVSASLPTLRPGTYTLTASYAGDNNFLPSVSAPVVVTVPPGAIPTADFALAASAPTAQTIPAGNSATYTFTTQTQGALSSPILLTASGLPSGATATFSPTYLPPGDSSNTFTLTVTTLKPAIRTPIAFLLPTAMGAIFLSLLQRKRCGKNQPCRLTLPTLLSLALLSWASLALTGCGDRIATNSRVTTQPTTYAITVTATATDPAGTPLLRSATVSLTLQ